MLKRLLLLPTLAATLLTTACTEPPKEAAKLPIMGERDVRPRADGGPADTVFATVPRFRLVNQAGQVITNQTFAGRAYVADFFFATCPGICPKMQGELLKVYTKYAKDPRIVFLSHTIDPAHDTIPVLKDYAQRLGVTDAARWHFATTGAHGEPTADDRLCKSGPRRRRHLLKGAGSLVVQELGGLPVGRAPVDTGDIILNMAIGDGNVEPAIVVKVQEVNTEGHKGPR